MSSSKTTTKTIRIANEVAEYFKDKALNRAVESLYGLLTTRRLSFDGEDLKVECTHQNSDSVVPSEEKTDLSDLSEMAELMRVTTEKILADIKTLIEDGTLYYENGRLVNPRYDELERICERRKIDIDNLISKVIRDVENGK